MTGRLALAALAAVAAFPVAAHADPLVCVGAVHGKSMPVEVCPPVEDSGRSQTCVYTSPSETAQGGTVWVCSTYL